MYSKHIIKVIIWAMLIFAIATCGSEGSSSGESSDESSATDAIVLTDQFFSTDSFIAAGWKKSKEYDTATVPESTEIWYGFFQQKDIEIRFYASHEAAIEHGVPAAEGSIEGAVKRSKGGNLLDVSGGSFTGYSDFLVAGNAVLLCEFDRTKCDVLVSTLK
ncbi:MAG: hypothetical protein HN926_09310 [Chloroflexi bacterium]|jgi:hypothetical protein|nr:hypothetical protein [Chloroflexota bacterium]MBT3863897.1 hypothetical protein [Chloroflexota bacterium]MBT4142303.1 hypothetical protein [Chloroflexota bacterium]MBT4342318.1 hypothetical protein [Chloroflexota bacterium]MBT4943332.1 hypothetical protein [Chloroflexota bacterium]